jgi:hypothetical protein
MQLAALVALAGFLFVTLLAASPALHEALHGHDAASPTHQCAATLLSNGSVAFTVAVVTLPVPLPWILWSPLDPDPVSRTSDYRLSPSRAPPAGVF